MSRSGTPHRQHIRSSNEGAPRSGSPAPRYRAQSNNQYKDLPSRTTSPSQDGYLSWRKGPGSTSSRNRERSRADSSLPDSDGQPQPKPDVGPKVLKISHADVRPGMCVFPERDVTHVTGQWSKRPLSRGGKKHHKHLEIVLSKSAPGNTKPYLFTVMITSFGSSKSLKDREVDPKKFRFCVPLAPTVRESEDQLDPVSFKEGKGLREAKPCWIIVHRRLRFYADNDGQYEVLTTEMDDAILERLEARANSFEAEALAALEEKKAEEKGKKKGSKGKSDEKYDNIMTAPKWR